MYNMLLLDGKVQLDGIGGELRANMVQVKVGMAIPI